MRHRNLGGTDIAVSEVGFGVWTVSTGWWGEVDDERSVRLLRDAYERDLDFCLAEDTVPVVPRLVGAAFVRGPGSSARVPTPKGEISS